MTQTKPTAEGLIEWHRLQAAHYEASTGRIAKWGDDVVGFRDRLVREQAERCRFHTEAIATLTRMEEEVARLRGALEEAEETFRSTGFPPFVTPDPMIDMLGRNRGYGALMQQVVACWAAYAEANGTPGSQHTQGACFAVAVSTLAKIRAALSPQEPNHAD